LFEGRAEFALGHFVAFGFDDLFEDGTHGDRLDDRHVNPPNQWAGQCKQDRCDVNFG
jgi:hypothetical protein